MALKCCLQRAPIHSRGLQLALAAMIHSRQAVLGNDGGEGLAKPFTEGQRVLELRRRPRLIQVIGGLAQDIREALGQPKIDPPHACRTTRKRRDRSEAL